MHCCSDFNWQIGFEVMFLKNTSFFLQLFVLLQCVKTTLLYDEENGEMSTDWKMTQLWLTFFFFSYFMLVRV